MERTHRRDQTDGGLGRRRAERAGIGDRTKDLQSAGVSSLCFARYAGIVEIGGRSTSVMSCSSRCGLSPEAPVRFIVQLASSRKVMLCASPTPFSAHLRTSQVIIENSGSDRVPWVC